MGRGRREGGERGDEGERGRVGEGWGGRGVECMLNFLKNNQ